MEEMSIEEWASSAYLFIEKLSTVDNLNPMFALVVNDILKYAPAAVKAESVNALLEAKDLLESDNPHVEKLLEVLNISKEDLIKQMGF